MFKRYLILLTFCLMLVFVPVKSFAGVTIIQGPALGLNFSTLPVTTDSAAMQLTSYYDLRNRKTFVQVSNVSGSDVAIHVQIFRNDLEGCPEINFNDTLTPNDTHIYDLDNIAGNAAPVSADLGDDSHGFVVITQVENAVLGSPAVDFDEASLIGNFRIIDDAGYEYRTNSAGTPDVEQINQEMGQDGLNGQIQTIGIIESRVQSRYTVNFNQLGQNNQSDIVGIPLFNAGPGPSSVDDGFAAFEAFVFNDAEGATSCDIVEFSCGGFFGLIGPSFANTAESDFLNLGINDIFPATNGDNLICPGNQDTSGFVDFIGADESRALFVEEGFPLFIGFAGLNNGDGTGSMESWTGNNTSVCDFFPDGDCPLSQNNLPN